MEDLSSGVSITDLTLTDFRIDLAQSDALRLLSERDVLSALARMRRDPSEPITEEVAREVAEREGAAAVIAGEVGPIGSGFVINARVLATESGDPLAQFRVTAASEDSRVARSAPTSQGLLR